MINLTLIAAMGLDRTIGLNNAMPWHISEDFKHFKAKTMGKIMIMGRKTFESIGKPLPGRQTIVVSRTLTAKDLAYPACYSASSFETALEKAQVLQPKTEIMVVGGGQIYQQALAFATHMSLTIIQKNFAGDTFFPVWDNAQWQRVEQIHHQQLVEPYLEYSFEEFTRTQ